ncbi:hypothetical protein PAMA_010871 [Pampus argenteus]
MTSMDPLKSVISIGDVDDTSLALPSLRQCRSGQQRVLEQVQSMKRTKSRYLSSKNGSSPTSPLSNYVLADALKLSTSTGSDFFGNTLSQEININGQTLNSAVSRNTVTSGHQYERSNANIISVAAGQSNTSRSEPGIPRQHLLPNRSAPPLSNKSTYRTKRSNSRFIASTSAQHTVNAQTKTNKQFVFSQMNTLNKKTPRLPVTERGDFGSNWNSGVADITMKEAVEYLSIKDETYKYYGASYIQHNTFIGDTAKEEVLKLKGIPLLVGLLRDSSSLVSQTASAALRNLSFKNSNNKNEIQRCGGITEAVALLSDTDSVEIQKQLTGLLWNLSSAESLKPELLKSALPVFMERVILPYTTGSDRIISQDPEVFFHTTACLRNLSSTKQSNRQAMRKCRNLVDSLVSYLKDCTETAKPDDKSVENCVCILHNLTFQLEAEAPALFSRITALTQTDNRTQSQSHISPIGCFSQQSKMSRHEHHFDFPVVEDPQPNGAGWLIHSKTLHIYLSLLGSSQQEQIQEACCGVLQNLTAHEGIVSSVMSQTIVQKLNGMQVISPLLKSNKVNLKRTALALMGSLTQNSNLHDAIARKVLPELLGILSAGTKEGNESDDILAMACRIVNHLLINGSEMSRHLLNKNLINSLNDLSKNRYFPKSSKAASLLLYNLWSDKDTQSFLKKQGMSKSSFVNDITTAVHRSIQVID